MMVRFKGELIIFVSCIFRNKYVLKIELLEIPKAIYTTT